MDLSSFNEEGDLLDYWNNWSPSMHSQDGTCFENQVPKKVTENVIFNSSEMTSLISCTENSKCGNWVPPIKFIVTDFGRVKKILPESKQKQSLEETGGFSQSNEVKREDTEVSEINYKCPGSALWKKDVNLDWGKRAKLHDVTKFNDGDAIWGIVNLGTFANIKMWVNEFDNICGLAEGKISKLYSSEVTYICITNIQLIRKMLDLSGAQWTSLSESLQETKTTLKFDAFQDTELTRRTNLEKLWIFICKRRHFLPDKCMLVKLCGAIKCMRKFQIIPKLLVQDIRTIQGEPIL